VPLGYLKASAWAELPLAVKFVVVLLVAVLSEPRHFYTSEDVTHSVGSASDQNP
jgi:hypothetical protein